MQQDPAPGNGAYDFLNQQPAQKRRKLPLPKLPKLAWIILITSVSLLFIVTVTSLLFGGDHNTNTSPYIESLAISQEISRVSDIVKQSSQDPNTQALAATASSVTISNNVELSAYLKDSGIKVDPKSLLSKVDNEIDTQLQDAVQSNKLPEVYAGYLILYLDDYKNALQSAYNQSGEKGKGIIKDAFDSVEVLLSASALKKS